MREMKDSGVEWIGEIPKDWSTIRLKYLLTKKKNSIKVGPFGSQIKGNDFVDEGVPVYTQRTVLDDDFINGDAFITKEKYSLLKGFEVEPLDFLITTRGSIGRVAIAPEDVRPGIIHPCIIKFTIDRNIYNDQLLKYIFNGSDIILEQLVLASNATTIPVVYSEPLKNVIIPMAPYNQQQKIVRYLNEECTKIDAVIKKQQAIIEKLKEYKLSLITESVTRGLNYECQMKDSGIDYIGLIPAHWHQCRLRNIGGAQNGISKGAEYFGEGFPFVSYGDVYRNYSLPYEVQGCVRTTAEEQEHYSVEAGDIFFTRTSETIDEVGFSCVCEKTIPMATYAGFVIRVRPYSNVLYTGYAKYYFRSSHHRSYLAKEMNLVTRASLGQDLLKSMPVLVPPKEEQKVIASFLDEKCDEIDYIISQKESLISKLIDYKKSMVYEAVTGKREVL